jgi:hypothetical protein
MSHRSFATIVDLPFTGELLVAIPNTCAVIRRLIDSLVSLCTPRLNRVIHVKRPPKKPSVFRMAAACPSHDTRCSHAIQFRLLYCTCFERTQLYLFRAASAATPSNIAGNFSLSPHLTTLLPYYYTPVGVFGAIGASRLPPLERVAMDSTNHD